MLRANLVALLCVGESDAMHRKIGHGDVTPALIAMIRVPADPARQLLRRALASATIGGKVDLYEPVHGSAPDIAGKGIANPIGAIASAAMLLRHTGKNEEAATRIETAIDRALAEGYRTADIAGSSSKIVSTSEMGEIILGYSAESDTAKQSATGK